MRENNPQTIGAICNNTVPIFNATMVRAPQLTNAASVSASIGTFVSVMASNAHQSQAPEAAYYYHGDHLGGAAWITDGTGQPVQHLQYYPFGEPFVNQRAAGSTYSERYTFTGKERDAETGYSYFGARYYDSGLPNIFLSVDPMSDKYPSISPYAYCAWNPVKLVDPDGKDGVCVVKGNNLQVKVIINYSKNEMDQYLKQIDYDKPDAFAQDFANYFETANGDYVIDGNTYNVSFNIIFNNTDDNANNITIENGSMLLQFDMGNNSSNYSNNTIKMGNSPRLDYDNGDFNGSFAHEVLHGLGLPDTKEYTSGMLSSYSLNRQLTSGEVSTMLEPCVKYIKANNIQDGKILIPQNRHYKNGDNRRSNPELL